MMVVFNTVSIPILIPFLQMLFKQKELVEEKPNFEFSIEGIINTFNYWLSEIIRNEGYSQAMIYMCFLIVLVFFGKNLFRYLSLATLAPLRSNIIRDIRQKLFNRSMQLPVSYYTEQKKGDLISRFTNDIQLFEHTVIDSVQAIFINPLMIIGSLTIMLLMSVKLTFFTIVLLGVTGLVIAGIGRQLKKQSASVQNALGEMSSQIEESIGGLRVIKAFTSEKYITNRFHEANQTYRNSLVKLLWRNDLASPLSEFLGIIVVAALIYYGFSLIEANTMDVAVFMTFIYAFFSTIEPSKKFSNAIFSIQRGSAAYQRIREIIDVKNPIMDVQSTNHEDNIHLNPDTISKGISFKNVTFSYAHAEKEALSNVSFDLPVGKVIALVGQSGAGKSTIADLIPRFYDVSKGEITIDGRAITKYDVDSLRKAISVVSQHVVLFHDTIYNNIVFGSSYSKEEVEAAARKANAHEFIITQPNGYNTVIGDGGMRLSGGQRQRLTLARAILQNAPILILDEATSALDAESENLVQDALFTLMEGRTCLVIAHRLSTIQHADEIIVMENGKIIERGTHEILKQNNGQYSKMVALQFNH